MPIINQIVKGGGSPAPAGRYLEFTVVPSTGLLKNSTTTPQMMDFTGVRGITNYALYNAYADNQVISGTVNLGDLVSATTAQACNGAWKGCTGLTGVNLSSLENTSGSYYFKSAFEGDTGLLNVDLSSLQTVGTGGGGYEFNYTFSGCTGLTAFALPALRVISSGSCFAHTLEGCTSIVSIDMRSLAYITSNCLNGFQAFAKGCSALTSVRLDSLKSILGTSSCVSMLQDCPLLTTLSLPALAAFGNQTGQFSSMFKNIPNITLHVPSNMQSAVEALTGYSTTAPFGAVSGTVLFDLPATVVLTGADTVEYERNPKYDTATALAWRVKDTGNTLNPTIVWTPYYTNGTTDPTVGATIYSDDACTTAVTTISSIA